MVFRGNQKGGDIMGNRYLILGVVVLFLFSLFTGYCFGEDAIVVGKLTTDKMVYEVDERITVAYSIENYCNTGWVPVLDAKCPLVFHYEIFNIKTMEQVASGDLIYSQVQYVWKHSTEVFAVGMTSIKKQGYYRILLYAPDFGAFGDNMEYYPEVITPSASIAVRIISKANNSKK